MVGPAQQFFHLVVAVGRAENMDFLAGHLLGAQAGLKQAAGLGAGQMGCQHRVEVIVAEGLLRQQHLAAGALGQIAQDPGVAGQGPLVQQVAGGGQGCKVRGYHPAQGGKGGCSYNAHPGQDFQTKVWPQQKV